MSAVLSPLHPPASAMSVLGPQICKRSLENMQEACAQGGEGVYGINQAVEQLPECFLLRDRSVLVVLYTIPEDAIVRSMMYGPGSEKVRKKRKKKGIMMGAPLDRAPVGTRLQCLVKNPTPV